MPTWFLIASLALPFLSKWLSGTQQQKQTTTQTIPPTGYTSPSIGFLDPYLIKAVLSNLNAFKGAGMPGGADRFGVSNWNEMLMPFLEETFKDVLTRYRSSGGTNQPWTQLGGARLVGG